MKRNKWLAVILVLLIAALVAVLGVIVFKTQEYKAGEEFYQSLRTGAWAGGRIA